MISKYLFDYYYSHCNRLDLIPTPEQIEQKTMMILGAIGTTQPDLIATVNGFQGGTFVPPTTTKNRIPNKRTNVAKPF